jgi:hypothetical protein
MTRFYGMKFGNAAAHVALILLAVAMASPAEAGLIDTLTGLNPGDQIGCDYTFQNGDPEIPCATDTVAANGTVSFLKPNAPFDNIEYFDITTGLDIDEILDPPNVPINPNLTVGNEYPILQTGGTFSSFFDVFTDILLPSFNNTGLELPGAIPFGQNIHVARL